MKQSKIMWLSRDSEKTEDIWLWRNEPQYCDGHYQQDEGAECKFGVGRELFAKVIPEGESKCKVKITIENVNQ